MKTFLLILAFLVYSILLWNLRYITAAYSEIGSNCSPVNFEIDIPRYTWANIDGIRIYGTRDNDYRPEMVVSCYNASTKTIIDTNFSLL